MEKTKNISNMPEKPATDIIPYRAIPMSNKNTGTMEMNLLKIAEKHNKTDALAGGEHFIYTIKGTSFKTAKPISQGAKRLYFHLMGLFLEQKTDSNEVSFTVKDWLELTKRTHATSEGNKLEEYIREIYDMSMTFSSEKMKGEYHILQSMRYDKKSKTFYLKFSDDTKELFSIFGKNKGSGLYKIPEMLFSINNQRYPYAFSLCTYIYYMKRVNAGKGTENRRHEDIHSMKSLLEVCEGCGMPSFEHIKSANRNYAERIFRPFAKNMNYFKDAGLFDYVLIDKDGCIYDPDYAFEFIEPSELYKMNIRIKWIIEPDYSNLIQIRQSTEVYTKDAIKRVQRKKIRESVAKKYG